MVGNAAETCFRAERTGWLEPFPHVVLGEGSKSGTHSCSQNLWKMGWPEVTFRCHLTAAHLSLSPSDLPDTGKAAHPGREWLHPSVQIRRLKKDAIVFPRLPCLRSPCPKPSETSPLDHLLTLGLLHQASTLPPLQLPDWAPGWLRHWEATIIYIAIAVNCCIIKRKRNSAALQGFPACCVSAELSFEWRKKETSCCSVFLFLL